MSFNDPFDCNIELLSFEKNGKLKKKHKSSKEKFKHDLSRIGICCFSTNKDSILMWSHYADNHKGYCIEFHKNENELYPVNYINEFRKKNYYNNKRDSEFHITYSKSKEWEYENEYRSIITDLDNENPVSRKLFFSEKKIKSIYFGAKSSSELKMIIISILKNNYSNYLSIKLYENHLSSEKFEIISKKIN